jgi:hypothetical protein
VPKGYASNEGYRLDIIDDTLYIINPGSITLLNKHSFEEISTLPCKNIYAVFKRNDIVSGFDASKKYIININYPAANPVQLNNSGDEAITTPSGVFYFTSSTTDSINQLNVPAFCVLREQDNNLKQLDLTQVFNEYKGTTDPLCRDNAYYCKLLDFNADSLLLLPTAFGFLLKVNKKDFSYKMYKTVDPRKNINFVKRIINLPNGATAISCAPENGGAEYLHLSVCRNSKFVFVNSFLATTENGILLNAVDAYDANNLVYSGTYIFKYGDKKGVYLLDVEADNEYIYLLNSNSEVNKLPL